MKIETRRFYRARNGQEFLVDRQAASGAFVSEDGSLSWNESGTCYQKSEYDLIGPALTLEVGKTYRTHGGWLVRITGKKGCHFTSEGIDRSGTVDLRADGKHWDTRAGQNAPSVHDLVEEVSAEVVERRIQVGAAEPKAGRPISLEHEALIRAALDGKQIQWHNPQGKEEWLTFLTAREAIHAIASFPERKFRVKPNNVVFYVPVRQPEKGLPYGCGSVQHMNQMPHGIAAALRVELDPTTLKVVSVNNEEVK